MHGMPLSELHSVSVLPAHACTDRLCLRLQVHDTAACNKVCAVRAEYTCTDKGFRKPCRVTCWSLSREFLQVKEAAQEAMYLTSCLHEAHEATWQGWEV